MLTLTKLRLWCFDEMQTVEKHTYLSHMECKKLNKSAHTNI